MASTSTKVGHGLAKALGIKLDYRNETGASKLTRGESVFSVDSSDSYVETEPTAIEWIQSVIPTGRQLLTYLRNLFPFTHWIFRYNLQWFLGDLVAGITVGAVVVPQGMAYAKLAELPVQFGLYSSFMGVLIYWFFATSKDITIGVSLTFDLASWLAKLTLVNSLSQSCLLSLATSSTTFRRRLLKSQATSWLPRSPSLQALSSVLSDSSA